VRAGGWSIPSYTKITQEELNMGFVDNLISGIPINPVLRERLFLVEEKHKLLEKEKLSCKKKLPALNAIWQSAFSSLPPIQDKKNLSSTGERFLSGAHLEDISTRYIALSAVIPWDRMVIYLFIVFRVSGLPVLRKMNLLQ
jgi:hypothetical protein